MDAVEAPRETPAEMMEGVLQRVSAIVRRPADPPGNEWNFACGTLFALSVTGQLEAEEIERYESRIQAEGRRLNAAM